MAAARLAASPRPFPPRRNATATGRADLDKRGTISLSHRPEESVAIAMSNDVSLWSSSFIQIIILPCLVPSLGACRDENEQVSVESQDSDCHARGGVVFGRAGRYELVEVRL